MLNASFSHLSALSTFPSRSRPTRTFRPDSSADTVEEVYTEEQVARELELKRATSVDREGLLSFLFNRWVMI